MQFNLSKQKPKSSKGVVGTLSINNGTAYFFSCQVEGDSHVLEDMERCRIEGASSSHIFLSGFEHKGYDKDRKKKFFYQEWILTEAKQEIKK